MEYMTFIFFIGTMIVSAMGYILYTKLEAMTELFNEIDENSKKIDSISERLADIEVYFKVDEEAEDQEEDTMLDDMMATWEDELEDRFTDIASSLNYHVTEVSDVKATIANINQYIGEVANFADRQAGRITAIEQFLNNDRPE